MVALTTRMSQSPDAGQTIAHQGDCICLACVGCLHGTHQGSQIQGQPQTMQKTKEEIKGGSKIIKKCKFICSDNQNLNLDPIFLDPSGAAHSLLKSSIPPSCLLVLVRPRLLLMEDMAEPISHLPFAFARVQIFPSHKNLMCFPLPA